MCAPRRGGGFTLLELLVAVGVIAILAGIAFVNYQAAHVRAKVSASKNNLRVLANAMTAYHGDWNSFPAPAGGNASDPFGLFASSVLSGLTTPVAYVSPAAFRDPFGAVLRESALKGRKASAFDPPTPMNQEQSFFYFYYPHFSELAGDESLNKKGYCAASVGPDQQDSLIVYYPFPASLTSDAQAYGIYSVGDTVYDPTNGAVSGGDIAAFDGDVSAPPLLGGGGK